MFLFIDNFSRYSWFFSMTHKSKLFDIFASFKNLVENLFIVKLNFFDQMVAVNIQALDFK